MQEFENLDKRLALLEQKLDLVLDNHLSHIEKDMAWIKKLIGTIAVVVVLEAGFILAKFNGLM
jgi:Mg2+ and Co2+ transporter CorA